MLGLGGYSGVAISSRLAIAVAVAVNFCILLGAGAEMSGGTFECLVSVKLRTAHDVFGGKNGRRCHLGSHHHNVEDGLNLMAGCVLFFSII
jgi:hypothetical protein